MEMMYIAGFTIMWAVHRMCDTKWDITVNSKRKWFIMQQMTMCQAHMAVLEKNIIS
jgi:hypothetical protein